MRSHEIDYEILGEDIQVVQIELDPSETVIAEAGSMLFMEDGIQFETKMGDGSNANESILGKLFKAGSRVLMGESLFMTHFTNRGHGKRKVAFAAPYPGTIKAVDLSQINGNTLIVQKDAFLCAAMGTQISIHFNKRFGAGLFGGEGFILERIQGDGLAFIHSGGVVMERTLNNETLRIDTGCIVGYEPQLNFDIQSAGGLKSMVFGGEGMFLATLSGTGKVWIQSLPISKLIRRLSPAGGNANKESGSVLGGITDMFER
ncbi:TIGR00266 family protein [Arcticibacterium luteifluviistationis]|uniref:TIGR00266 family protein n=1 Tax=Arcticibacterium luteifluviistationis TaxID=1784714 RepID=A0A2Z4GAA1_9BACT|nr:TIGR00266 family protein [Arcticibacterium luteifluviistationis]AWV97988.1 TIGR00266 family protein [Arcticibacterium luteifluviistationis]